MALWVALFKPDTMGPSNVTQTKSWRGELRFLIKNNLSLMFPF